ncbi:hypothetical protein BDV38DRAFT_140764 [Aspergillus pseudotamarii]|uniref:Uncharacterized protein n=1 Tax=Aspergillus pseudotamarii TaxID=132259 RepID=A0A5N6SQD9_ASPPS|nr:uncharacterized protein BDV38DRAFT_140764 [Aspergillus pseudotamarii]KAE8135334.1 hypothetical protein BDV38DRAFT_140764 [Aspergillus pseudotamarii]
MQICQTRSKRGSPPTSRTALMPSLSVQNPPERWEHHNQSVKIFYHRGRRVTGGGVMVGSPSEREPRKQDQRGWCTQKAAATRVIAQKVDSLEETPPCRFCVGPAHAWWGITPPCPMIRAAVEGLSPPTNSPSRLPLHIRIPPPSPPTTFFLFLSSSASVRISFPPYLVFSLFFLSINSCLTDICFAQYLYAISRRI